MYRPMATILFVCFFVLQAVNGHCAETSQIPPTTRDGQTNLTYHWLHHGGGRLYWKALTHPLQIRLNGARFVDPASVPLLLTKNTQDGKRRVSTRRSTRYGQKSQRRRQAQAHVSRPPRDVGKTALRAPAQARKRSASAAASATGGAGTGAGTGTGSKDSKAAPPPVTTYTHLH